MHSRSAPPTSRFASTSVTLSLTYQIGLAKVGSSSPANAVGASGRVCARAYSGPTGPLRLGASLSGRFTAHCHCRVGLHLCFGACAPSLHSHPRCLVGCPRCYSMAKLLRSRGSSRPRCTRKHLLKRFSVTYAMRVLCDGCDREMPTNAIVHGCRQCDVDYCSVGGSGWCQSLELLEWRCHTAEEGPACPCRDGNPALT